MSEAPLRIAFVALGFPPDVGGTELYNVEYAKRLHSRGHELALFTWSEGREAEERADRSLPFDVHRVASTRRGGAIDPEGVEAWLARVRPDVALLSRASRLLRRVAPVVARRAPTVVSVHELGGRHTSRGWLGRWRVRRRYGLDVARHIVVNSEDTRGRVASLRVEPGKLSVVHPGVDTSAFAPDLDGGEQARKELDLTGCRVLLTVSRIASNKGHARVIEVLPALVKRFPELVYVVVGEGTCRPELEGRAAELGLGERVRFVGRVDDVVRYYHAAEVFVMPSGRSAAGKAGEGFGISYVEAGACGRPVVASASGGGAEAVVDGETGRVVDPEDASALESALADLLVDPAGARRLGEAARTHCARFDWERGTDALEAVLREVGSGR